MLKANDETFDESLAQLSMHAAEFNPNHVIEMSAIGLDQVVPRWNVSNAIGIGWDQPAMIFFLSSST